MALMPLLLALASLAGLACFVWSTLTHFADTGERPWGMKAVFILPPLGVAATLATIALRPLSGWPLVGLALYAVALALFWWAIAATRKKNFSIAFSSDVPNLLVSSGPYAWVRHPFYTSYVLYWIAGPVGTGALWLWVFPAIMAVLYWRAARAEEEKFARSDFAEAYNAYKARTWMFAPWVI